MEITHPEYIRGFYRGRSEGYAIVQEIIIKLWKTEMECDCEDAMGHLKQRIENATNFTSSTLLNSQGEK